DSRRKDIFLRLAAEEEKHAGQFGERIVANGGTISEKSVSPLRMTDRFIAGAFGSEAMLRRMEAEEERNIHAFNAQSTAINSDPISRTLFEDIEKEEQAHSKLLASMDHNSPSGRLEAMLKGEKWHVNTGTWIGDAIYGMNDGLTAVFGIVSGMAGLLVAQPNNYRVVIGAGMLATLASALSMGSSAFLAAKAEREVYEAEIGREKREIDESPEHEIEELALIYELKGFTTEDAQKMARTIAAQPETFLRTMAHEELGLSDRHFTSPWLSALTGTVSTAIGGVMPVLPFVFLRGESAIVASVIVSTLAHFAVGAAKTMVTARNWFHSGIEMTVVGVSMGVITYLLGAFFKVG
ncbi:MAG: VIT1/CCC1 transporter family protein, partial [Chthonomonadales bacterium]